MNTSSKAFILIIAITAFAIGVIVNSAQLEGDVDSQALLTAQLLSDPVANNSQSVGDHLKELTLVNFWASWCAPCREEMPVFEAMLQSNAALGFQVIGIAIDSPEKAQPMLDSMGITYPILYAEQTGMLLMEASGNPQGLLPYSLLLDNKGRVLEQRLGKIHEQDISIWIEQYLK
jgi:thiol-disulfide isomerase/thioredoxin